MLTSQDTHPINPCKHYPKNKENKDNNQQKKETFPLKNISNIPNVNKQKNMGKKENKNDNINDLKLTKTLSHKTLPHPCDPHYFILPKKGQKELISLNEEKFQSNPQYLTEYSNEIFEHLKKTEQINIPNYEILESNQKEITENARAILINWLFQIQSKFELLPETLYLTINIIDRYLEKNSDYPLRKYQLVGVTAMLIASKYEEIYAPEIRDFLHITKKMFSYEDVIEVENKILSTLKFDLLTASPYIFLVRFHLISGDNMKLFYLSQLFLELSLLSYDVMKNKNSLKASCSLYLARKCQRIDSSNKDKVWSNELKFFSGYDETELRGCIRSIYEVVKKVAAKFKEGKVNAIIEKFKAKEYLEVSKILFH